MAKIPARTAARLQEGLKRFQPVVASAATRDVNESDTSIIVTDMLADLFGYDKYAEITREYAIRSTYCDLAIKLNDKPRVLIEIKAVGIALKEQHTKQAVDYAANLGLDWVVLTNAVSWKIYKLIFGQPIDSKEIFSFEIPELNPRSGDSLDRLFMLSKEGFLNAALEEFCAHREAVNKFNIAALITTEPIIKLLRRELQRVYPEIKVQLQDIEAILLQDVLKREVVEGEEAKDTAKKIQRALGKLQRQRAIPSEETATMDPGPAPELMPVGSPKEKVPS